MITRIFAGLIFLLSINAGNALAQMTRKDSLELKLKTVKGNERVDVLVGLVKLIYKNDLPQGKKLLAEAESLSVSYPRGKVDILCRKAGFAWFEKKDASQEIAYYNEALTLAESISYEAAIPDIYSNICASLCDLSKFDECHKVIERGFKWADKAKDEYLRAKILQQEGVAEYYQGHVEQALVICEKSLALFEKLKVKREVAGTGMNIGVMKYRLGQTEESLQYYDKALKAALELKDSGITAKVYVNIGLSESRLGKDEKAIVRFKDAEVIYRKIKDMKNASGALENAGVSYLNMGKPAQALKCLLESAKIKETEKNLIDLASSYLNIGSCYENLHDTAKTIEFSIKAKDLYHEAGNEYFYAHALRSLGALYSSMRQFDKAKKYLDEAMEIQKRLGDMPGYGNTLLTYGNYYKFQNDNVNALKYYKQALAIEEKVGEKINIAGLVNNLGKICFDAGRYSESAEYYQRALAMRREIKNMRGVAESYLSLADVFGRLKDFKKAYEYEVLYHKTWDSLNSKDIVGQMAEMNAKYETAKKDKEIIERKTAEKVANAKAEKESLERKNAENKFLFAILGVSLLIALAGFVIRGNIQRKKANVLLTSQNNEITKQKSEIEEQKLLVEEKQKEIIDSITYAKRLQEAILPSVQSIKDQLPESFVLYKPKDLVAGDFYWMEVVKSPEPGVEGPEKITQHNERRTPNSQLLLAVADCTGHGVPGAMVSVVCSNALNRTVKEFRITEPGKILDKVRELVIATFEHSGAEVRDGMDISLCSISRAAGSSALQVEWAGANNPLFYIENGQFKKIQPDKQPIGSTYNSKPFTTHRLEMMPGTVLYLFTDGFADQFGGTDGKKFKSRKLEEILLANAGERMEEQKQKLDAVFEEWRGNLEQVDDVSIIGIRL